MNHPWSLVQYGIAAVLLAISLIGVIGTLAFDAAELTFSFAGAIQAFAIFPGLVLSLTLNASLMRMRRAPAPGTAQRVMLVIEFVLIAALLVFHFYTDPAGTTLGLAIIAWPVVIVVAIVVAVLAIARLAGSPPPSAAPPVSPAVR
jgi:hypothetical protein